MSWNTMAVFAQTDLADEKLIELLGCNSTSLRRREDIQGDQAITLGDSGLAVGRIGKKWKALWTGTDRLEPGDGQTTIWTADLHRTLCKLSGKGAVLALQCMGVIDRYGFELYQGGELVRGWLSDLDEREGDLRVVLDEGEPLEEETTLEEESDSGEIDPEERVLAVLESRVAPVSEICEMSFARYR